MKLHDSNDKGNIFSNKNISSSYGAIGVHNGPIKINQKIKIVNQGTATKSSQNTAQNSMSTSSKKMKVSKTYASQIQGKNLNNSYYHERLAEQRAAKQLKDNRNPSCTSHGQNFSNPAKNQSFISGKPRANLGASVYEKGSSSQGIATEGSANHNGV
jgi:hypothetical protein